ncbi:MAG TPA: hypothetical protein VID29_00005, partial [Solirubrobacteraceae bacterium]
RALADAETFPYYKIYWVGRNFDAIPLTAVDGSKGYGTAIGDSVYYGDCARDKGILGGGTCLLPLQITTVIYRLHSNDALGPQRNTVLRGVPATIYDGGRSIEIYSGRVAIDISSDTLAHALDAARRLRPLNATGSATGPLPAPIFCPGLSGPVSSRLRTIMDRLPGRVCQLTAAAEARAKRLS